METRHLVGAIVGMITGALINTFIVVAFQLSATAAFVLGIMIGAISTQVGLICSINFCKND